MPNFTCIACHVAFADGEIQRNHYKTDWHRYNLKRKVAELPPVTEKSFQERLSSYNTSDETATTSSSCVYCKKHFTSERTYQSHLLSKKHQEIASKQDKAEVLRKNAKNIAKNDNRPSKKKETPPSFNINNTPSFPKTSGTGFSDLNVNSSSKYTNLPKTTSAGKSNSNNVRDEESDDDDDDDDEWEDEDDEEEWEDTEEEALTIETCLFCSKESISIEDNLKHMVVAHSFFIPDIEYLINLDGLISYLGEKVGVGKLCLWCSDKGKRFHTVQAVQHHMLDKGHCKMLHEGDALLEYEDFYDYSRSYPDIEDNDNEEVSLSVLDDDDYQLVLPSGSVIGHRSLLRYYRQNIPPNRRSDTQKTIHQMIAQYRALGWTGTTGDSALRHARDVKYMKTIKAKHYMQLGVRNNKLQKHFRQQVLF